MNFIIVKPELSQADFLQLLIMHFPSLEADVLDDTGLIHLQVASLARYANDCLATARLDELQRVFEFFHQTIEKVDSATENALYVSFLEHVEMGGDAFINQEARKLLKPEYLKTWEGLQNWLRS
jgi:hypothetical protein